MRTSLRPNPNDNGSLRPNGLLPNGLLRNAPPPPNQAEYRYTDFGSYTKNFPLTTSCSGCASPSSNVSIDLKESFHTFRVGLAFDLSNFGKAPY